MTSLSVFNKPFTWNVLRRIFLSGGVGMLITDFKKQDKLAAEWLLNYHDRKEQHRIKQEIFSVLSATTYSGLPHGTDIGMPTENKGVALAELEEKELWLKTIEDAESTLSEKKQAFIEFRRRAEQLDFVKEVGRPGWVDYVQVRYADWHEKKYGKAYLPSKNTLHSWWNEIVDVTVRIAIRRGCL
jgi:hypothetical protein